MVGCGVGCGYWLVRWVTQKKLRLRLTVAFRPRGKVVAELEYFLVEVLNELVVCFHRTVLVLKVAAVTLTVLQVRVWWAVGWGGLVWSGGG